MDASGAQDPLRAWRDFVASPWGRVRYAVAARAVDEALARESGVPGQVVAGGLDDLAAEAPVPGGLLSVALPTPASAVLRSTLWDGPRAGLAELELLPHERKHDPDWFADLLELGLRLCDTEPFHRLGQFLLLVGKQYRRGYG